MANRVTSPQVCACLNVGEQAITQHLAGCAPTDGEALRLGSLQAALKCGTQCGSCLPTLKKLVRATAAQPAVAT
jgi:assimilatory nitrate reductase catalytic subunit